MLTFYNILSINSIKMCISINFVREISPTFSKIDLYEQLNWTILRQYANGKCVFPLKCVFQLILLNWTILGQYTVGMSHLDKNPLGLKSHLDQSHHLDNSPLGQ